GVLIYRKQARIRRYVTPSGNRGLAGISLIVVGLLALPVPRGGGWATAYDVLCVYALFPAIICFAIECRPSGLFVPAAAALGAISYPLYAVHEPILRLASIIATAVPADMLPSAAFGLLAAVVALSYLIAVSFDLPVRRALHRLFDTRGAIGASPRIGRVPRT
ncbi:MAG TPA: hypothetical protein VFO41_17900, partial [Alphaproteobacteria bacterium]|nr:hypothetical protein [Alphaproteobacteria bacterium]